jgi:hypothetical protein
MRQLLAIISLFPFLGFGEDSETNEPSAVNVSSEPRTDNTSDVILNINSIHTQRPAADAYLESNPVVGLFKEGVHLEKALQFTNAGISDIRYLSETPENLSKVINYVNEGVLSPAQVEKFAGYCVSDEFGSAVNLAFEPAPGTLTDRRRSFVSFFEYGKALLEDNAQVKTPEDLIEFFRPTHSILLEDITLPSETEVYIRTRNGESSFNTFSFPTVGAANFTNVVHPDISSTTALTVDHFSSFPKAKEQNSNEYAVILRRLGSTDEDQVERLTGDDGIPQEVTIEEGQLIIDKDVSATNSNLAIGQKAKSESLSKSTKIDHATAMLIRADINTGGNLAIGSLGQIQVEGATFTLGTSSEVTSQLNNSSPDHGNLYMYANELIEINGLTFGTTARIDDIYMEAITINLKDVTFPAGSDIYLTTRDGTIDFDTFDNPTIGAANFTNVIHPDVSSTALTESDFIVPIENKLQTTHNAVTVGKL